jgi:hypothetical protein
MIEKEHLEGKLKVKNIKRQFVNPENPNNKYFQQLVLSYTEIH